MKIGDKNLPLPYNYPRNKWEAMCRRVYDYKEELKRLFSRGGTGGSKIMEYEKFIASIRGREAVLTIKYDGELNLLSYDQEHPFPAWFNKYVKEEEGSGAGKMRTDILPLSKEIEDIFKERGVTQIVLIGELYALSSKGDPLPFGDTLSILVRPEGRDAQIYYAVFDILELNGKPVSDDYWKKCLMLQEMFAKGIHVHPVFAKKGDSSVAEQLWKEKVLDGGYEGFVVHTDGTIKVKPSHTYDLAVIGFEISPGKTYTDSGGKKIKSLVLAWMDEDGVYRYCCNCGNGLNETEQLQMGTELNPLIIQRDYVIGNHTCHMVQPKLVVNISCAEVLPERTAQSWKYDSSTGYTYVGDKPTAALRFPKFVPSPAKFRRDKSATNKTDVRIDQIPDWGEPVSQKPIVVAQQGVSGSGTANPKPLPATVQEVPPPPKPVEAKPVAPSVVVKETKVVDVKTEKKGTPIYCIKPLWTD